jgi:hypothetical protein
VRSSGSADGGEHLGGELLDVLDRIRRSMVAGDIASTSGFRLGTISTLIPIRTRDVRAPIAAITTSGS